MKDSELGSVKAIASVADPAIRQLLSGPLAALRSREPRALMIACRPIIGMKSRKLTARSEGYGRAIIVREE
jgi:hypothetical protein